MATSSGLEFPIGFDFDTGTRKAEKDAEIVLKRLEKTFGDNPITIKAGFDPSAFDDFKSAFDSMNIKGIIKELEALEKAWKDMTNAEKYDSGTGNLTSTAQETVAQYNELTTALASYGKSLSKIAGEAKRAAEEEVKAEEKKAEKIRKTREKLYADLRAKVTALAATENTIANITAKLQIQQERLGKTDIGSAKFAKVAEEVNRLSIELEKANQILTDFQQKAFRGLGDVITKDNVEKLTAYRNQVRDLDEQFNRLRQSGGVTTADGKFTAAANNILKQRQQIVKNINDMLYTATEAQAQREQRINDIIKRRKAIHEEIARVQKALAATENTIANITAKLQIYNTRIQSMQVGSDMFNKTALEIRRLAEELDKANQRLADFQQKAFKGLGDVITTDNVTKLTAYREQLNDIEVQFNKLRQSGGVFNTDGTLSSAANSLLKQRQQIQKEMNDMVLTAADAQLQREKEITATIKQRQQEQARIKAQHKAELDAIKQKRAENDRIRKILAAQETTVAAITAKLQVQQQRLQHAEFGSGKFTKIAEEVKRLTKLLDDAQNKIKQLTGATTSGSSVAAASAKRVNDAMKEQTTYVERLIKRMAVYASFGALLGFIKNVREVTAQFELQRVSLGAIIQDQEKANQLFSQIKSFALKSPLKIMDLVTYTKQVAAYRIETDKLFDTTKRLADVSVGLGVDMQRIVLAYGQVKAASYLRAAEIRQFTEAGIPLLDLLAKKLTDMEGKLVSTEQVMDRVSKRMISFEMVEEIFNDMTDAGGIFYNMQEKQSQTLYGMWAKLGDAASIMYSEIGNTENVNEAMKTMISLLDTMMRNWKTTARVINTVAASIGAYMLVVKSVTVATAALTKAEAANVAMENLHAIGTPKLVTAIIGKNNALGVSLTLTRLHYKAMVKQATATNILSKAFWKLTAAMLANPWAIAAAAIVGITAAIIHFTGNAETAEERIEKLSKATNNLVSLKDFVDPLVQEYNELSNKVERTAAEEKKLKAITDELARKYPGAISSVREFGDEIDLLADKLSELHESERKAREDLTRAELAKTESMIKQKQAEIAALQATLGTVTKNITRQTVSAGGYVTTEVIGTEEVVLSDAEKADVIKKIDKIRETLVPLEQAAHDARVALGEIPTDAAAAVDKFGGWKKQLQGVQTVVEGLRGGKPIRLFTDTEISGFNSAEDAAKKVKEAYDNATKSVENYKKMLESKVLTEESRKQIEDELKEAEAMETLSKEAATILNVFMLLFKNNSGNQADPRLSTLQGFVTSLKQINKEYEDLAKKEGNTKALRDTQRIYGDTLKEMDALAKKYKFDLPTMGVPTNANELQEYLRKVKTAMAKLPKSDKSVLSLQVDIDKTAIDNAQKDMESKLKTLSEQIAQSKAAKDFYDKIFEQTHDYSLAANLTLSIYGGTGEDLQREIVEQIQTAFQSNDESVTIPIEQAIDPDTNKVDYSKLLRIYNQYKSNLIEGNKDLAKTLVQNGVKESAAKIQTWYKELEKAKSLEQQRTEVVREEEQRRKEIMESTDLSDTEKINLVNLSYDREIQQLSKLDVEIFKSSDDYIKAFGNLDYVSKKTLTRVLTRLKDLIAAKQKTEDVTGLKELVNSLEDIQNKIAERDPFGAMKQDIKDYVTAVKEARAANIALATAQKNFATARIPIDKKIAKVKEQISDKEEEIELEGLSTNENSEKLLSLTSDLIALKQELYELEQKLKKTGKAVTDAEQQQSDAEDRRTRSAQKFKTDLEKSISTIQSIADSANSIADSFGISEDSEIGIMLDSWAQSIQLINTLLTATRVILEAIKTSNYWMLAISIAVTAIVTAFTYSRRMQLKRYNDELYQQSVLLDYLKRSYNNLEDAMSSAFGSDYLSDLEKQKTILEQEVEAYKKQAELEEAKGKKKSKEAIESYLESAKDAQEELDKLETKFSEFLTGSDIGSAASDFADAWLDAYASFSDTTDAIEDKFNDMINNIVKSSLISKIMKRELQDIFDYIDAAGDEYENDQAWWDQLKVLTSEAVETMEPALNNVASMLSSFGINLRDSSTDLTGISRDIATASEESINGLAAGINTQNYYISYVPYIAEQTAKIVSLLGGNANYDPTMPAISTEYLDLVKLQNEHLAYLPQIATNTQATAERCERAASACESMYSLLGKVIKQRGAQTSYAVSIN